MDPTTDEVQVLNKAESQPARGRYDLMKSQMDEVENVAKKHLKIIGEILMLI